MAELTILSSKGQIVVPKGMREDMRLVTGTPFAIFGKGDTIILKKVNIPTAKDVFEKVHKWGVKFAEDKGLKEGDINKFIHKGRGIKGG